MEAMLDHLVMSGVDDWLMMSDVVGIAKSMGTTHATQGVEELCLDLIRELVDRELMIIGDVDEHGFQPWGIGLADALERVKTRWSLLKREPTLGDICWLTLTERGEKRAAELARQVSGENSSD